MKEIKNSLTLPAVAGNIIFMLWIAYNGISEGFQGTVPEKISYIGLMGLLVINTILVLGRRERQTQ